MAQEVQSVDESIKLAENMIVDFDSIIYKYEDYPDASNHLNIIEIAKDARRVMQDLVRHIRTLDPEYFNEDLITDINNSEREGFDMSN